MADNAAPRRILRLPGVIAKTGLGRDSIYRAIRAQTFPAPIKLTARASGWDETQLDNWIAQRAGLRSSTEQRS